MLVKISTSTGPLIQISTRYLTLGGAAVLLLYPPLFTALAELLTLYQLYTREAVPCNVQQFLSVLWSSCKEEQLHSAGALELHLLPPLLLSALRDKQTNACCGPFDPSPMPPPFFFPPNLRNLLPKVIKDIFPLCALYGTEAYLHLLAWKGAGQCASSGREI